jgi:hypothetical protein
VELNEKYPRGYSRIVYSEGLTDFVWNQSSFFIHPHYGLSFATKSEVNGNIFLRVLKISDAREMLEKP